MARAVGVSANMPGNTARIDLLLALLTAAVSAVVGAGSPEMPPAADELPQLVRISQPDEASCGPGLEIEADCRRGACKSSAHPSIDDSGTRVVFSSDAERVVCASPNPSGALQVYLRELGSAGAPGTVLVTASCRDGGPADQGGDFPRIAGDGSCIVYSSWSADLVPHDRGEELDVFVHTPSPEEGLLGVTERISQNAAGAGGNGPSGQPAVSRDGRYVAFISRATNLLTEDESHTRGAAGRSRQILLADRWAPAEERFELISVAPGGDSPFADGPCQAPGLSDSNPPRVAFHGTAGNLAALALGRPQPDENDVDDVFVRDVASATTLAVSVSPTGRPGDAPSRFPAISSDGRWVAFESAARNLLASADDNGQIDVFVRDLERGETVRVSVAVDGRGRAIEVRGGPSVAPCISGDGRFVVFSSGAVDLRREAVGPLQVFAHDRDLDGDGVYDEAEPGARRTWCLTPGRAGTPADGWSGGSPLGLTRDGRHAVFMSIAGNLVPGDDNGRAEINPGRCCQRRGWVHPPPSDCGACCCTEERMVPPCEWGRDVFRCRLY